MTPLERWEAAGFQFRLSGDDINVRAPRGLATSPVREQMGREKPQIMDGLRVRLLAELVNANAVHHYGITISQDEVRAELDAGDIEALRITCTEERQVWAALLAHRLFKQRTQGWA